MLLLILGKEHGNGKMIITRYQKVLAIKKVIRIG